MRVYFCPKSPTLITIFIAFHLYDAMMNIGSNISSCSAFLSKIIGLITLFVCFHAVAYSQDIDVHSSYVLDQWTVDDGLPVNNVVDILQAQNGYLWLATFDGLARFDGVKFNVFQSEQYPGLPSNRIVEITETPDGSIWMLTEQSFIVQFRDGQFIHHREETGLNGDLAAVFFVDPNGMLWIGSNRGISVYDGDELKPYRPKDITGSIQYVFAEKSGAVWFKKFGERVLTRKQSEQSNSIPISGPDAQRFLPIYQDPETEIVWIGSRNMLYGFYEGEQIVQSQIPDSLSIAGIGSAPNGDVWLSDFGTNTYVLDGLETELQMKRIPQSFAVRSQQSFLQNREDFWVVDQHSVWKNGSLILSNPDHNYSYTFDREGNLWIGTRRDGLIRLKKNLFQIFDESNGLPFNNTYALAEDYNQQIWVGTYGGGAALIRDETEIDIIDFNDEEFTHFNLLYSATDSTMYAVSGRFLTWLKPGEEIFNTEYIYEMDKPMAASAIYESPSGEFWLGSRFGVFIGNVGNWEKVDEPRFTHFPVRFIKEAPDHSLWLATNGAGIAHFQNDTFSFYGSDEGFSSNIIRSLYIDDIQDPQNYTLLVGSEDQGLIRVEVTSGQPNMDNVTRYGTQAGMLDYIIHSIQKDDFGFFWFNTNRGIFRIARDQLEQYHYGEINRLNGVSFTESDGLRNREGNGGNQSAGLTASDGRIWFAGQAGVVAFDPADFVELNSEFISPVVVEEIATNLRTILNTGNQPIELDKIERDFEVHFTALSLISSERNNFRYRLRGYNEEWIEAGRQRTAVYTNIPKGTYTFEVMASNNTGMWNPEPAGITFTIAPYFYETIWFKIGILALFGLLIFAGFQWRLRSLKRYEELLKQRVDIRTIQLKKEKEKTDKQAAYLRELDKSKTQFFTNISHELRTPLTLIMSPLQQMLSENGTKFDAETKEEFQRMLRNSDRLLRLIDQTMEINRLVRGKVRLKVSKLNLRDFVDGLIELFVFVANEKEIDVHFHSRDGDFTLYADPDKMDEIIANLLSNAIKFTPEGGKIDISIIEENEVLEVKIADTGIGISFENLDRIFDRFYQVDSSETRNQEGSGIGLSLVSEFVKLHQGELSVVSEVDVGTIFTLRFKKGFDHFSRDEIAEEISPISLQKISTNGVHENGVPEPEEELSKDQTTVLIVEDNADLRAFIAKILREEYRVLSAANGEEGLEVVSNDLPDLIIADIMMPKIDGITFNRMLKQNPETASIPLIFLTAKSTKKNRIEGFKEGGDAYLTKPFDPLILKAQIHNLISSRFRLREILAGTDHRKTENGQELRDLFVEKALAVLAQNFTDPDFNVTKFSKALYLDRSQVLRKLKESVDLSPSSFIKKYRMDKAAELLQNETDNISEVAYAVGFKSLSYFSYCFKEHFQLSPSDYLKSTKS